MSQKSSFTLAEVLITLVIIGIIAAITVPLIYVNYQKQSTISKLKKAYSEFSSAVRMSETENGPVSTWDFTLTNKEFVEKYLEKFIIVNTYGKERPDPSVNAYVFYEGYNLDGQKLNTLSGVTWYNLADGTSFKIFSNIANGYFWIFIDLNSDSKPNRLGRDIFMFDLYKQSKFIFWPYDWNIYTCKKGTGVQYAGGYCGAVIFNNGWEMPKDYPW